MVVSRSWCNSKWSLWKQPLLSSGFLRSPHLLYRSQLTIPSALSLNFCSTLKILSRLTPGINGMRICSLLIYQNKTTLGRCGCSRESWDLLSMDVTPISFSRKTQGTPHLLIRWIPWLIFSVSSHLYSKADTSVFNYASETQTISLHMLVLSTGNIVVYTSVSWPKQNSSVLFLFAVFSRRKLQTFEPTA